MSSHDLCVNGRLRLLSAAEQERLRDTFLAWFRLSVSRTGVDLEFLEDRTMMEQMEQVGALRTTLEERFEALHDAIRTEARAEGIERERKLLRRQTERKFGTEAALRVAGLLAGTDDQSRLEDVGEWIIDCEEGSELIARLEGTA